MLSQRVEIGNAGGVSMLSNQQISTVIRDSRLGKFSDIIEIGVQKSY